MRILFLAPEPLFSHRGTPIAESALLEAIAARGHAVDVVTYHEGEDLDIPGVRIHRIPDLPGVRDIPPGLSWKKVVCDVFLLAEALRRVRSESYDLVHGVEEASFVAWLLERWRELPYVYDMDSLMVDAAAEKFPPVRWIEPVLSRVEASIVRNSTAVIAVCELLERHASEAAPEADVFRLEDASLLEDADQEADDLARVTGTDGPFVLYVGNLRPVQGIELLLDAFRQAAERVPEAHLVVIGGKPDRIAHYRERAREMGIDDRVHLVGPRPIAQLAGYLEQATVLVSPRRGGVNTPMKIYSYLDSGRPVLATRLPTHTQVLDDRVSCLVAPEAGAMADGLVRLLERPELREELGRAGRELARREYSPRAFREKAQAIYEEIGQKVKDGG